MAEVDALGYESLLRPWRIDLAGWAARSPSQARRSESVRWRTGSMTSPEVVLLPLEIREGALCFAGERFLKPVGQSFAKDSTCLSPLPGL